jgi:hypothetical protein
MSIVGGTRRVRYGRAAVTLNSTLGVHDDCQCQDKVFSIFEGIVACAGTAGDVSSRFIHALDWSDGGT